VSRSLRRGVLAATAIVFSLASLSACGAGNSATTLQIKPDNPETTVDQVKIQNVNVITQPHGAQGPAVVSARIFNGTQKDQTLESITVRDGSTQVKLSPAKGSSELTIPAGGSLALGGKGNASAVLSKTPQSLRDGNAQPVVFHLSETGNIKVTALVVPAKSYFKDFGPSTLPTPSASASPSATFSPTGAKNGDTEQGAGDSASESAVSGESASASESAAGS
jgi:hypothetical protein